MSKPTKGGFYAVQNGRQIGVFLTWGDCEASVKNFPGARYRKFASAAEAEAFVMGATSTMRTAFSSSENHSPTKNVSKTQSKKRGLSPNVEDESGWDVVYSDGACKGNGKTGSVAGVGVWWGHDDPRNIAERCPGDQTNNRAELIAILRILETAPMSKKPLLIKSDSQYSINCFKQWLPNWIRNNFRSTSGAPIKNVGIIRYLSAHLDVRARNGQKVRLQYVKGHSGDEGNDGADMQANVGATMSPVPERSWETLERQFRERVEQEWRNRNEDPGMAPMEVSGPDGVFESRTPVGNPSKIRKIEVSTSRTESRLSAPSFSSKLPAIRPLGLTTRTREKAPPGEDYPKIPPTLTIASSSKNPSSRSPSPTTEELIPRSGRAKFIPAMQSKPAASESMKAVPPGVKPEHLGFAVNQDCLVDDTPLVASRSTRPKFIPKLPAAPYKSPLKSPSRPRYAPESPNPPRVITSPVIMPEEINLGLYEDCLLDDADLATELSE